MADFPALEVMSAGPHGLAVGHRVPLRSPLVLGRGRDTALAMPSALVSPRHCEVVFEHGRWWVRDLGSSNGTFVAGESISDAELRDGDCFELPYGVSFRLLLSEPEDLRDEAMEAALRRAPDDARQWSVYADWLQEAGAALGERLSAPRPEDDARWLGPMAGDVARGELQVQWDHGLPRALVLRCVSTWLTPWTWEQRLAAMVRLPAFRFVREVEVDLGSFTRAALETRGAVAVLQALGAAWPMLESVTIGPGSLVDHFELAADALARFRLAHPRLTTDAASLFRPWGAATLTLEAQPEGVRLAGPPGPGWALERVLRLGPSAEADVRLSAPWPLPEFVLSFANDRWRLEVLSAVGSQHPVRLNGVRATHAYLRPGDVVEPTPGLRFRFEMQAAQRSRVESPSP